MTQPVAYVAASVTAAAGIATATFVIGFGAPAVPAIGTAAAVAPALTALIVATDRLPTHRHRPRIRFANASRPVLVLTDTPRPGCSACRGEGWWAGYVQDGPNPEDGERLDVPCDCWSPRQRRLFPIPARLARRLGWQPAVYSDEPPF